MNPSRASVPWSLAEARTSFLGAVAGAAIIAWSWWESSGTGHLSQQTAWGNAGVLGIVLIGGSAFIWVTSGRRAVKARRDSCAERLEELLPGQVSVKDLSSGTGYVILAGSHRYHRGDCLLVAGKNHQAAPTGSADLTACEMCLP